jgi:predicted  nucleic acid-binding Zn-ribbon protein
MHPDLERLKSLQEADREIQRLNDEIAALPERVAKIEAQLAEERALVEKAKAAIKENEKKRREHEGEIQGEQQKISKYRDQSLEVKTNEQYRALMDEIGFAEKKIRGLEDSILEAMLAAEAHEGALKKAEADLKREMAEIEKEKAEARARTEQDQKELAEWNARRSELRSQTGGEALAYYDHVSALRKPALAEAIAHNCSACHVMVRPQKYEALRAGTEIITCDSCSRILFYDPAHEPAPAPPKSKRKRKPAATEETSEAEAVVEDPATEAAPAVH